MYFKSKKTSLLILAITAVLCSRTLLLSFNDPEGPNLLVVMGMAAIIYFLSLAFYIFGTQTKPAGFGNQIDKVGISFFQYFSLFSYTGLKRLAVAVVLQIIIAVGFFLLLN